MNWPNNKVVVALDVDGVLFPFYEQTLHELQAWGVPLEDPTRYGWSFTNAMTSHQLEIANNLWKNNEFTEGFATHPQPIMPYEWAKPLYEAASRDTNLFIVTSPMSLPYWASGRDIWLKKHFGHNKRNTAYMAHKQMFMCDLLIDDKPETIVECAKSGRICILLEREYSRNDPHWEEASRLAWRVSTPETVAQDTAQAIAFLKLEFDL